MDDYFVVSVCDKLDDISKDRIVAEVVRARLHGTFRDFVVFGVIFIGAQSILAWLNWRFLSKEIIR
jgi:hypothetical protein